MNYQKLVKEFQIASGHPYGQTERAVLPKDIELRKALLKEEIGELEEACDQQDMVLTIDALCDIKYINDGTANMFNTNNQDEHMFYKYYSLYNKSIRDRMLDMLTMHTPSYNATHTINKMVLATANHMGLRKEQFQQALNRVHDSNMSKFCKTLSEAEETVSAYKKRGIDTSYKLVNGLYVITRRKDGKILKSINYKPVYLDDIAEAVNEYNKKANRNPFA